MRKGRIVMKRGAINQRTGQPFNNESNRFVDWTDKKLIEWAKGCHEAIYVSEWYGIGDCQDLTGCTNELEERGYIMNKDNSLIITKMEDEE